MAPKCLKSPFWRHIVYEFRSLLFNYNCLTNFHHILQFQFSNLFRTPAIRVQPSKEPKYISDIVILYFVFLVFQSRYSLMVLIIYMMKKCGDQPSEARLALSMAPTKSTVKSLNP